MTERFDLIVVGSGQAGPFLAATMAGRGQRVALIEARDLGGTCVNYGCTPTKTLRKSARVAHVVRNSRKFGVEVHGVQVDFAAAMARMRHVVEQSRSGLETWLGRIEALTIVKARGRLVGKEHDQYLVETDGRTLAAPRVVLNTGTRPARPAIRGLEAVNALDNESLLGLRERPKHLVILGGSYIGLEFGQIFHRLGSDVTVIEGGPRLAPREDVDVSEAVTAMLRDEGIGVHVGVQVELVEPTGFGGIRAVLADGTSVSGSHFLLAVGRTPNTDGLGLETIGVETDNRGYVRTNERFETSAPGVFALGDINGRGAFTHTSYHDHEILLANWSGDLERSADARVMTYAMFTDPPLGHVGLYEADARRLVAQGRRISQAVFPMSRVSRAKEEGETVGLIKLLVDEDSGAFLGASMLGIGADEIIQVIGQVMAAGGTWRTVREALPVHPTVTEFFPTILDRRVALGDGD